MPDICDYCGEQHADNSRLFPLEGCPVDSDGTYTEDDQGNWSRVYDWSSGSWIIEREKGRNQNR